MEVRPIRRPSIVLVNARPARTVSAHEPYDLLRTLVRAACLADRAVDGRPSVS